MTYIGVTNIGFEKTKQGLSLNKNGELYLGQYSDNLRNKAGIYYWEPTQIKDSTYERDMYIGQWVNDKMEGKGMYVSIREGLNRRDFEIADMDVYIGIITNNRLTRGTQLLKQGSSYFVYHGAFDENGHKKDENAYYYISDSKMLINGHMDNDHFLKGSLAYFDSENSISDLAECTFDEDGTIKTIKDQNSLNQFTIESVTTDLQLFFDVLFSINFFLNIYDKFNNTKDFIEQKITSMDVFDDTLQYSEMVKHYSGYYGCDIYNEIETKVFKRKVV